MEMGDRTPIQDWRGLVDSVCGRGRSRSRRRSGGDGSSDGSSTEVVEWSSTQAKEGLASGWRKKEIEAWFWDLRVRSERVRWSEIAKGRRIVALGASCDSAEGGSAGFWLCEWKQRVWRRKRGRLRFKDVNWPPRAKFRQKSWRSDANGAESVRIPSMTRKQLTSSMKIISSLVSDLYVIDVDIALNELCKDDEKFEQLILGKEFHISLGRPVPIKVHQIDSIVAMLRQRLQFQRRYWMEFNKWDAFVNDELTRSFLSLEVTGGGLLEITKQICIVDEIYRLHGLPEFYKNPRPHISLVWALGDVSNLLKPAAEELNKLKNKATPSGRHFFTCKFSGIECRIGKKSYTICKLAD